MSFEKNLQEMFKASLSFVGETKTINADIKPSDHMIYKTAGEYLKDATEEIIESKVNVMVRNEIKQFPETVAITTFQVPSLSERHGKKVIISSAGNAVIKYKNVMIKLPFIYRDNTIESFESIQIDGRRIPYSRETLLKTLNAIKENKHEKQDTPYIGLAKPVNPSTSTGFLGDTLRVRELASNSSAPYTASGTKLASLDIERVFDKVATLDELTEKDLENLLMIMEESAVRKAISPKIQENKDYELKVMDNINILKDIKNIKFCDLDAVEHNSFAKVVVREVVGKSTSLRFVPVKVIKEFSNILPPDKNIKAILISNMGEILIIKTGRSAALIKGQAPFKITTSKVCSLKADDNVLVIDNDKVSTPYNCSYSYKAGDRRCKELDLTNSSSSYKVAVIKEDSVKKDALSILEPISKVYTSIPSEKGFNISNVSKDDIHMFDGVDSLYMRGLPSVLISGENSQVIKITSTLSGVITSTDDLFKQASVAEAIEIGFEKSSSSRPKVKISVAQKNFKGMVEKVDVSIEYVDKSKAMFRTHQKDYRKISYDDLINLLRYIGFEPRQTAEILNKLKMSNSVTYFMPKDIDFNLLEGADIKNISLMKTKAVVNNMVRPKELGIALAASMSGALIADGIKSLENVDKEQIMGVVNKLASDAKKSSVAFEKIAVEKSSHDAKNIALISALASNYYEKLASYIEEEHIYPKICEVSKDILSLSYEMEKIQSELFDIRISQKESEEVISEGYLKLASDTISNLYSTAYNVCKVKFDMEKTSEEIRLSHNEKIASALKGLAAGSVLGASMNSYKAKDQALEENPMALSSDYAPKQSRDTAKGAVIGAGVGLGAANLMKLLKKTAEMNVPNEEEKEEANNVASDDSMEAIVCKECDYKGDPNVDGRCPKCGAVAGDKKEIKENDTDKVQTDVPLESLDFIESRMIDNRDSIY